MRQHRQKFILAPACLTVETIANFSATPGNGSGSALPRALLVSLAHTRIIVIIILALTAFSALSAAFSPAQNGAPTEFVEICTLRVSTSP